MLKADSITHRYGRDGAQVTVLNDVSIEIPEKSFTAVVGRSGSGKSTLLSVVSSLLKPEQGQLFFRDENITWFSRARIDRLRSEEFSIIFQSHHLLPYLSAHENVLLPYLNRIKPVGREIYERGLKCLERVGLAGLGERLPGELSGGEQQRVAIARALVKSPSVLFADEPCGSLDKATGNEVMSILQSLNKDGLTIVMVTHDPMHAEMASRIIRLEDGKIAREC
ncbi:ABC transporter ATP-binding protein [Maridesulfovibrio sp. FT414]|uniref:ABC transporter ATP-binding protein n=1 Tax=Maridesulfovibrio sp. FT414 TaxID=2979469 RepID=UPI003D807265